MPDATTLLTTLAQPHWLVPLLLATWLAACAVMAQLAGWRQLARSFAAGAVPAGASLRFVSGSLGSRHWPMRYRRCLRVVVGTEGLYLAAMFPFGFRAPPLFIPWRAVAALTEKQALATRTVTLEFAGQWAVLTLPGPVGQWVKAAREAAGAAVAVPPP